MEFGLGEFDNDVVLFGCKVGLFCWFGGGIGVGFVFLWIFFDCFGGGGDGGLDLFVWGEWGGGSIGVGVCGWFGILKVGLEGFVVDGVIIVFGFRNGEWFEDGSIVICFLGGDWGGCIVKDGGWSVWVCGLILIWGWVDGGGGVGGFCLIERGFVGGFEEKGNFGLGFVGIIGVGGWDDGIFDVGWKFCSLFGFGVGEMGWGVCCGIDRVLFDLFMFLNCVSREEMGFCELLVYLNVFLVVGVVI